MQDRTSDYYENNEMAADVNRYENFKKNGKIGYFDIGEIENVVNFYIGQNQVNKAYEACLRGLKLHPGASELKLKKAQLLVGLGKPKQAIETLHTVNELMLASFEFPLTLGMALVLLNKYKAAQKQFNSALNLCGPDELEDVFLNIGESFENNVAYEYAINYYLKGVSYFKNNEEFYFRLGFCYDKLDEYEKSIANYQKYLDINPFSENVWYNIGILYNKIESYDKAVEAYDFAIALDTNHYDALFNKANALANNDKFKEAIEIYFDYLQIHENSSTAKYYIGECYIQLNEFDKALNYFDQIILEQPDFAEAYYGKAMVYEEIKNHEKAIGYYLKSIELDDFNADAWFSLANIYLVQEDYKNAIIAFKKAVEINKFDTEAWIALANIYYRKGDYLNAIALLKEANEHMPENHAVLFRLSAFMLRIKMKTEGSNLFRRAIKLKPEGVEELLELYPELKNVEGIKRILNTTGENL